MSRTKKTIVLGLFAVALWITAADSRASTPAEQVKETIDRVLTVLNGSSGGGAQQRESVRSLLLPRFDFSEMARKSLGAHWDQIPERQGEFVAVFTDFVEKAYVGRILSLKEERIVFVGESVDNDQAQVDTRILDGEKEPLTVNYKLHLVAGNWKVYDVVIENISLVSNYRSQFHRILRSESFDGLIERLKAKGDRNPS